MTVRLHAWSSGWGLLPAGWDLLSSPWVSALRLSEHALPSLDTLTSAAGACELHVVRVGTPAPQLYATLPVQKRPVSTGSRLLTELLGSPLCSRAPAEDEGATQRPHAAHRLLQQLLPVPAAQLLSVLAAHC